MSHSIRILLADDHYLVRCGLRAIIEGSHDMEVVAEADDGVQAIKLYREVQPDIAILDCRMPVMDGPQAMAAIRSEFPNARLIALSHYEGDEHIALALKAGAATYVFKRVVDAELPEVVRAVFRGEAALPADVSARLQVRDGRAHLTERERAVLTLIARGKTNKEVANALGLSVNTINNYVAAVLAKLGVDDRTAAVTVALHRGLVHLE
ncbi:MAG: response regulator transcription factor [Deltaproteobacteria bacterium]|nr:response regulator transcription factor [Deltaproteobacteria bacterium]